MRSTSIASAPTPRFGKTSSASFEQARCRRPDVRGPTRRPIGRWRSSLETRNRSRVGGHIRIRAASARSIGSIATEYNNAIRDLFALDLDVKPLAARRRNGRRQLRQLRRRPVDFDRASRAIPVRRSTGHAAGVGSAARETPAVETFEIPLHVVQDDRQSEDLPFGSRGGIAVRLRLSGRTASTSSRFACSGNIRTTSRAWDGRSNSTSASTASSLKRFTVGGEAKGRPAAASYAGDGEVGFRRRSDRGKSTCRSSGDAGLEVRVPVEAGPHLVGVSFVRELWEPEGLPQPLQRGRVITNDQVYMDYANVGVSQIGGPYQASPGRPRKTRRAAGPSSSASRKPLSEESACATKILSQSRGLAYRRPVTTAGRANAAAVLRRPAAKMAAASTPEFSSRSNDCSSIPISCFACIATPTPRPSARSERTRRTA